MKSLKKYLLLSAILIITIVYCSICFANENKKTYYKNTNELKRYYDDLGCYVIVNGKRKSLVNINQLRQEERERERAKNKTFGQKFESFWNNI